jgi:phosphatidylglycerol:prolipoprotein diacylglycerol transferase
MDPIAFSLNLPFLSNPLEIRWYGIMMACSMLLGSYIGAQLLRKIGRPGELIWDGLVWIILAGIGGARLVYVFTNLADFVAYPAEIIRVDHGGLSFHGGIIGGVLAAYFYFSKHKISFIEVVDGFAPGVAIGVVLVRIGNFMNGDILGYQWDGPWAMNFPYDTLHYGQPPGTIILRHPTELYGLLVGLITLITCLIVWKLIYIDKKLPRGANYISFIFTYSIARSLLEDPFRDVPHLINLTSYEVHGFGSLTYSQAVDILLVLICIWAFTQLRKWDNARLEREKKGPGPGNTESRQERRARERADKARN